MTDMADLPHIVIEDWGITRREEMASYLVDMTALALRPEPSRERAIWTYMAELSSVCRQFQAQQLKSFQLRLPHRRWLPRC
ncbi:MAG: hypothetical protein KAX25_05205 [Dehalococcoidia bacterium]|nr:hypothetical protein [Dehalococcoidia bacterium]